MPLVIHEITKTRECMNAVFDRLDDLCDRLDAFCEKKERDHRVNRDVAISKSTSPAYSCMESMESDYRPLRFSDQHVGRDLFVFITKSLCILLVSVLISLHQTGLIWTSTGRIPKAEIDLVLCHQRFWQFHGCQTDINIVHFVPTCAAFWQW